MKYEANVLKQITKETNLVLAKKNMDTVCYLILPNKHLKSIGNRGKQNEIYK